MSVFTSLVNHFLIAMPALDDPNFSRTVTLICDHTPEGAMGIVINRETDLHLGDILEQLDIDPETAHHRDAVVGYGGPVEPNRGFVLHEPLGHWDTTMSVTETLGLTASQDILRAIADERGPDNWMMTLGYAGWGPGQLENEMSANAWLHGPADSNILFRTPAPERWHAAASRLGVDLDTLHGDAGHA
jgi:putative transcriptional regulator